MAWGRKSVERDATMRSRWSRPDAARPAALSPAKDADPDGGKDDKPGGQVAVDGVGVQDVEASAGESRPQFHRPTR